MDNISHQIGVSGSKKKFNGKRKPIIKKKKANKETQGKKEVCRLENKAHPH